MTQTPQVFQTPDEIAYYRFASLKFRLGVERAGMTFRDGATRPQLAAEFGLKPRDPLTAYIAYCETQMALLLAKRTFPQAQGATLRGGNPS